jgi:hypothetical protein
MPLTIGDGISNLLLRAYPRYKCSYIDTGPGREQAKACQ